MILLVGVGVRFVGAYGGVGPLEAFSLLPSLAGLCLLCARLEYAALGLAGNCLPGLYAAAAVLRGECGTAHPLQRIATTASAYCLQTLGFPAFAEGNIIQLEEKLS